MMLPLLETILSEFGKRAPSTLERRERAVAPPDLPDGLHTVSLLLRGSSGSGAR